MNETKLKVEIEKINYYDKILKNELFKRNDFLSRQVVTSEVTILLIRLILKLD